MKKWMLGSGVVVAALAAAAIDALVVLGRWRQDAVAVPLTGTYASNRILQASQRFGVDVGTGPEGLAVDAAGRLYVGFRDGQVVTIRADATRMQKLGRVGAGRPQALTFGPDGGLVIAAGDAGLRLLRGKDEAEKLPVHTDAGGTGWVTAAAGSVLDKNVYLVDAGGQWGIRLFNAFLERAPTGRLLRYNVASEETAVLAGGLAFPAGVALGPGEDYLLVSEAAGHRIIRYWLKGDRAGRSESFIDPLPGMPAQIVYDDERHLFWVAMYAPRSAVADRLAARPDWQRRLLALLPRSLLPLPADRAWVLGLSVDGRVVRNLQDDRPEAYAPVSSVQLQGPWLYLGSDTQDSLVRFPVDTVIEGAEAPPPDWQRVPATPELVTPAVNADQAEHEHEEEEERESLRKRRRRGK